MQNHVLTFFSISLLNADALTFACPSGMLSNASMLGWLIPEPSAERSGQLFKRFIAFWDCLEPSQVDEDQKRSSLKIVEPALERVWQRFNCFMEKLLAIRGKGWTCCSR